MDRIWAPWRKKYVTYKKQEKGCFFCRALKSPSKKDPQNLLLRRSQHSFIILNRYPYNNGHVMVAPNRHVAVLEKLTEPERLDLLKLVDLSQRILIKAIHPQGFNIGMNLGRAAGAGVPGHIHIHVVPRWAGDTNFMPIIGKTKVISDSLQSVYRTLSKLLRQ